MFASWDAEEFGIIGSSEWAEDLKVELQQNAVAYLNVDIATTGENFYASAVPSLKPLVKEVTQAIIHPLTHQTIYETWKQNQDKQVPQAGNLGSGSDHSPFIGHLGIPSISMGFYGPYGVYHAMQDNFYWMEHFGDPTFQYQVAMAQIWGIMASRLANADILPFDYQAYAKALLIYLKALQNGNTDSAIVRENPTRLRKLLRGWESAAHNLHNDLADYLKGGISIETEAINRHLHQFRTDINPGRRFAPAPVVQTSDLCSQASQRICRGRLSGNPGRAGNERRNASAYSNRSTGRGISAHH